MTLRGLPDIGITCTRSSSTICGEPMNGKENQRLTRCRSIDRCAITSDELARRDNRIENPWSDRCCRPEFDGVDKTYLCSPLAVMVMRKSDSRPRVPASSI